MGHAYFESDGVRGHIHFADYGFRFLWWIMMWGGYTGPQFYINFPIIGCLLRWRHMKYYRSLTWKELWSDVRYSFFISEYEKMIEPGQYHVIWWVFNRWYKKNFEKLR